MALRGIKVIEMAGLAPAPFCGMILKDFGASVIRIDRVSARDDDDLARGKRSLALDLKNPKGTEILGKLCDKADVLIEPFRPGVMEKFGLGPSVLIPRNPRLIYARLTGFGQNGPWSSRAGHDINYVALTGVLNMLGRKETKPTPPINLLADFAGGGLTCAFGIVTALLERMTSGKGQVIDANMVDGTAYVSSFLYMTRKRFIWGRPRGENVLDSGVHFYETYETKDGKYMSVGALEPQFYAEFIKGLGFSQDEVPQLADFNEMKEKIADRFRTKTRDEWTRIFSSTDACVAPILDMDEAFQYEHNKNTFVRNSEGNYEPMPAPKLSRTPGEPETRKPAPKVGEHSKEILSEMGYNSSEIDNFEKEDVIGCATRSKY